METKYWPLIGRKAKGRFLTPVRLYKIDPQFSLNVHIKTNPTVYVMPPNSSQFRRSQTPPPLYLIVRLYKVVQGSTRMYMIVQNCTQLYLVVQSCTWLYKVVHSLFPLQGKANESQTPQIKNPISLLYSNMAAPKNFCLISFLIRATFCLPSPFGGRQTSLRSPKSKGSNPRLLPILSHFR